MTRSPRVGAARRAMLVAVATLSAAAVVTPAAAFAEPEPTPEPTVEPTATPVPPTPAPPTPVPVVAPVPVTGNATATSASSLAFSGTIATGGAATAYHFEYGTTTAYGLATPSTAIPDSATPTPVVASAAGLTAATTYHYRLVATNPAGIVVGADRTIKTAGAPHKPAVATRKSTNITGTSAIIVGRVNPYGLPTTYYFEWGTSSKSYGQVTPVASVVIGPTQTVTAPLTGLQPNTRYVYRVVATNAAGTVRSSPRSVTTSRGLTSLSLSAARRTISWDGDALISGTVRGVAPAGAKIRLFRLDHPFTGSYREIGSQKASSLGTFGFTLRHVYEATRLRVVAESATGVTVSSRTLTLRSRMLARFTGKAVSRTRSRLRGTIYPAAEGTKVSVQRRTVSGRWITVKRPTLRRSGDSKRATFSMRVSRSRARKMRYRMVVTPNDNGAHVKTTSHSAYAARRR